ncbi:hemagglutinin [Bifidobacterium dentium]|uniref:hemagglutinin n=1 Tax=Bifidobacterium dentium TaxID=1689 RepID=UPI001E5B0494|nr:hemagglutinin [Bifidobacterium dentium]MDU6840453.1 hemagglutinin [Bifidobacterium dentium]
MTSTKRRKRNPRRRLPHLRSLRNTWKKASLRKRVGMLCRTLLVIIIAIALVVGLVRFVSWRVEVGQAEKTQNQLQAQYDFNPGNIISDGQFFNGNALSEAQVRSFIEEQGAACSGERCLKTMTFDTESQSANEYCEAYEGGKNESAAAIIYKSGKACGVSQKVLLTVLQKEQHLLTATDPSDFQYKSAMGLSCPDDANCDPEYAGFFKQVYGAAKRYQYYVQHEDDYGYHAGALNYIQYHPNAECGGTNVYIENKATALLYIYTPYQPNTAALEAGAGEGDACSSYGNRNFAIIYSSWFGNPRG